MPYLTLDQLSAHFLRWLDDPAQAALRDEGDAREMEASDIPTAEQRRFLEAFGVIWDQVEAHEQELGEHDHGS